MKSLSGRDRFQLLIAGVIFLLFLSAGCRRGGPSFEPAEKTPPARIVSVVPSVTETLFALGLGDRVVGVSDYCKFPPEVNALPKLGGLYNPNIERIVELRPDLAVLLREHHELKEKLDRTGIETLSVDHTSVAGILNSFVEIAARCGVPDAGTSLRGECEERLEKLRVIAEGKPVSVLMVLDRDLGERGVREVYAAGRNRYFNDLLRLAGASNVLAGAASAVPTLSREGIIVLKPDVILDLSSLGAVPDEDAAELEELYRHDWDSFADSVPAVRDGRVYPILVDYATIPGPRFVRFAELISEILHPRPSPEPGHSGL